MISLWQNYVFFFFFNFPIFLPLPLNPCLWSAILAPWWGGIISGKILSRLIWGRKAQVTALKQAFDTKTVTNANSSAPCKKKKTLIFNNDTQADCRARRVTFHPLLPQTTTTTITKTPSKPLSHKTPAFFSFSIRNVGYKGQKNVNFRLNMIKKKKGEQAKWQLH